MKIISQFRILYRHFLFRLMDVELLSSSAQGDASSLLGQFGALLIFGSLLLAAAGLGLGARAQREGFPVVWSAERFLISLTMLVVGIFALLNWDSTFLDRRDVLVLGPLPVRGPAVFTAKIAAAAAALGLTVAALNSLCGFVWPLALAPRGSGLLGTLRFFVAFWIVLLAAGAFLYCAVLGVQAAAAQLPRRWYLRASSVLQIAAFMLFLAVICFQPSLDTPAALAAPENQTTLAWLPSYWFMALLNELSGAFASEGHVVMAPLARRAVAGLAIAILVAGGAFLLSYVRTLRKIVEEPDILPVSRGGIWLPRFGTLPQTALAQFVIRTLLRSRQHRVVLAFYLGAAFAIMAVYLEGGRAFLHMTWLDFVQRVRAPMVVSTVLMLCAAWLGARTAFSLPLDLQANWLFRVTPAPASALCLSAVRRALLALSVLPVLALSAALLLWLWPWTAVAQHLLVLGLLGSLLVDFSLRGFRKIPFTCSYLPGKSKVHMVFWFGIVPAIIATHKLAELELHAMADPVRYWAMVAVLAAAAFAARRLAGAGARHSEAGIEFEETSSAELVVLGLNG